MFDGFGAFDGAEWWDEPVGGGSSDFGGGGAFFGGWGSSEPAYGSYDWQRSRVQSNGLMEILGVFGKIGGRLSEANRARNYADDLIAARQAAYTNSVTIANAQKESNLKVAAFSAGLKLDNANVLKANAYNLKNLTIIEQARSVSEASQATSAARSGFARSGVQVGTGSALDVEKNILSEMQYDAKNKYTARLNQIKEFLTQSAQLETEAAFTEWSARDENRFIDARVQQHKDW